MNAANKLKSELNAIKSEKKKPSLNKIKTKSTKNSGKCEKIEAERKHACDVCDKRFTSNFILTGHKRVHTGEKPFKCDVCDKSFTQRGTLIVHKRIHSGIKPFKCQTCNKEFDQSSSFKCHLLCHNPEKTVKCHLCDQLFRTKGQFYKHKKSIHGEKVSLPCEYCDLVFESQKNYIRHFKSHSRPYKCAMCSAHFSRTEALKKHKVCHEIKPGKKYKCLDCKATFEHAKTLRRHNQVHLKRYKVVCNFCEWRSCSYRNANKHYGARHANKFNLTKCGNTKNLLLKRARFEVCSYSRLKMDIPRHLRNRVACEYCDITLPNAMALDAHYQSHYQAKYKCPNCNWKFRERKYLEDHLNKVEIVWSKQSDGEEEIIGDDQCDDRNPDEPTLLVGQVANGTRDDSVGPNGNMISGGIVEPSGIVCPSETQAGFSMIALKNTKRPGTKKKSKKNIKEACKKPSEPPKSVQKNLRKRRIQVSYLEEDSDTDPVNSDQDPDWFSDTTTDSSTASVDFYEKNNGNVRDEPVTTLGINPKAATNDQLVITPRPSDTVVSASSASPNEIAPLYQVPVISKRPNEVFVPVNLRPGVREPMQDSLLHNGFTPEPLQLSNAGCACTNNTQLSDKYSNELREMNNNLRVLLRRVEIKQGPITVEEEYESKSGLKKLLISQGGVPIRLYKPHLPIKREFKVKEEPQSD